MEDKYKTAILIAVSVYILAYILTSFVQTSFNFVNWDEGARIFVAFFGTVGALVGFGAYLDSFKK